MRATAPPPTELPASFLARLRSLRYGVQRDGEIYKLFSDGREVGRAQRAGTFAHLVFIDMTALRRQQVTSVVSLDCSIEALAGRIRRDIDAWRFAKPVRAGKARPIRTGIPRPELPVQKRLPPPSQATRSARSVSLSGAPAKAWADHLAQKPKRAEPRDEDKWHGMQARKWKRMTDIKFMEQLRHEG